MCVTAFCFGECMFIQRQETIYKGRLAVSKAELIQFLDGDIENVSYEEFRIIGYAPITHLHMHHFIQRYGETKATPEQVENRFNDFFAGKPNPSTIYSHTYWHGD